MKQRDTSQEEAWNDDQIKEWTGDRPNGGVQSSETVQMLQLSAAFGPCDRGNKVWQQLDEWKVTKQTFWPVYGHKIPGVFLCCIL